MLIPKETLQLAIEHLDDDDDSGTKRRFALGEDPTDSQGAARSLVFERVVFQQDLRARMHFSPAHGQPALAPSGCPLIFAC